MSKTGTPKSDIQRYMTHYGCSYAEARIRADRGDPLPERGTRFRDVTTKASEGTTFISNVLGAIAVVFGSISLLIRLFEKKE